jgi:signal peptidase II
MEAGKDARMNHLPPNRLWTFLFVAGCGLTLDLTSKSLVFAALGYPHRQSNWTQHWFDGWLRFRLYTSFNEGALWGLGQGLGLGFAALSVLAAIFIVYWLFVRGEARSLWLTVSLSLIMAGTLGNLYDRLHLHGCQRADGSPQFGVRDFLDFRLGTYDYPIFNFADTFLVTGAIMLTIQSFRAPRHGSEPARELASAASPDAASPDAGSPTMVARAT